MDRHTLLLQKGETFKSVFPLWFLHHLALSQATECISYSDVSILLAHCRDVCDKPWNVFSCKTFVLYSKDSITQLLTSTNRLPPYVYFLLQTLGIIKALQMHCVLYSNRSLRPFFTHACWQPMLGADLKKCIQHKKQN